MCGLALPRRRSRTRPAAGAAWMAVVCTAVVVSALGGGCGSPAAPPAAAAGSPHPPPATASGELGQARAVLARTRSLHFQLTSRGASGGGLSVTGGQGDVARPDQLTGSFIAQVSGLTATVGVKATRGRFYVRLPFQSGYDRTDPAKYGISDPSTLLDPGRGLARLLANATAVTSTGHIRVGSDVVDEVRAVVPGRVVTVPPDPYPARPVGLTVGIVIGSHQVRTLALTGPFGDRGAPATYSLTLTAYNEPVHVVVPSG